jgi:radical SAM superfamily enzyme YgiQ (UPF0313 family)
MVKKILLIQPPFQPERFFKKDFFGKGKQSPLFPFGIAYIASYLKKKGYAVNILDIYANQLKPDEVFKQIDRFNFDFIGISALVTQFEYVKWFATQLKQRYNVPIILGNGLGTHSYKLVLREIPAIDLCVRGEGEITFEEIVDNWPTISNINGISYRDQNGEMITNPERENFCNIDELPHPAYELFDMNLYINTKFYETGNFNIRSQYDDKKVLPILSSRGCPYNCNFCGKILNGARLRKIDNIINEMTFLQEKYHIDGFHFIDELVVVNNNRAKALSSAIKPLNILWDCQGRVNTVDEETLRIMKDSGCVAIGYGIESGSQKILDNMNKKISVEQIKYAMTASKKVELDVKVQLIFGYPGETIETLEETVNLFKEIKNPGRTFTFICPLPGTQLYEYALNNGYIQDELQFLLKIKESFDNNIPIVNFTSFPMEELVPIMKKYNKEILKNYMFYTLSHPNEFYALIKKFGIVHITKTFGKFFVKTSNYLN